MEYHVKWEIDIDAKSAKEAVNIAREFQLSPCSLATGFTVSNHTGKKNYVTAGPLKQSNMDMTSALAKSYINDAFVRAKEAFIACYGKDTWNEQIQPKVNKGIMSILDDEPEEYTQFFLYSVWLFVNKY